MPQDEPEITQIAKFIALRVPTAGVDHDRAVNGWRATLRHARKVGLIDDVIARLKDEVPGDQSLHLVLDEARR
jgi:hypothetical protein